MHLQRPESKAHSRHTQRLGHKPMRWLSCVGRVHVDLSEVDSGRRNPCFLTGTSLFSIPGNTMDRPANRHQIRGPEPAEGARSRRISLYFPSRSGIRPQRRVRDRLGAPPPSLPLQRLPARTRARPEKFPRFRGVLAVKPWRVRTGDCRFQAGKAPQPVIFSVAKFGGSVSFSIRLLRVRTQLSLPFRLRLRGLSIRIPGQTPEAPWFRGVLRGRLREAEAETAGGGATHQSGVLSPHVSQLPVPEIPADVTPEILAGLGPSRRLGPRLTPRGHQQRSTRKLHTRSPPAVPSRSLLLRGARWPRGGHPRTSRLPAWASPG